MGYLKVLSISLAGIPGLVQAASGAIKQSENKSITTYRVVVDVRVSRSPVKIARLEPVVQVTPRTSFGRI